MMTLQLQGCSPYSLKPNINASKKYNFVTCYEQICFCFSIKED